MSTEDPQPSSPTFANVPLQPHEDFKFQSGSLARLRWTFKSDRQDDLSLDAGAVIRIQIAPAPSLTRGWFFVQTQDSQRQGWIPSDYLVPLESGWKRFKGKFKKHQADQMEPLASLSRPLEWCFPSAEEALKALEALQDSTDEKTSTTSSALIHSSTSSSNTRLWLNMSRLLVLKGRKGVAVVETVEPSTDAASCECVAKTKKSKWRKKPFKKRRSTASPQKQKSSVDRALRGFAWFVRHQQTNGSPTKALPSSAQSVAEKRTSQNSTLTDSSGSTLILDDSSSSTLSPANQSLSSVSPQQTATSPLPFAAANLPVPVPTLTRQTSLRREESTGSSTSTTTKSSSLPQASTKSQSPPSALWRDQCPIEVLASLSKDECKRQEAIYELFITEQDFVRDMKQVALEVFLKPMQKQALWTPEDLNQIFSNLEMIVPLNENLLKMVEAKYIHTHVVDSVGDIFLHMFDYFKLYALYCGNYTHSVMYLQNLPSKKRAIIQEMEHDARCRSMNLTSYLIKPVQRLCKYPLLLRETLRSTPVEHRDHESIKKALTKVEALVALTNEGTAAAENAHRIIQITQSFANSMNHVFEPSRRLLKEGVFDMWSNMGPDRKTTSVYVFLFTDLLIVAKKKKDKYHLIQEAPMTELLLVGGNRSASSAGGANSDTKPTPIQLLHAGKKKLIFQATSDKDKDAWIKALTQCHLQSRTAKKSTNASDREREAQRLSSPSNNRGRTAGVVQLLRRRSSSSRRKHSQKSVSSVSTAGTSSVSDKNQTQGASVDLMLLRQNLKKVENRKPTNTASPSRSLSLFSFITTPGDPTTTVETKVDPLLLAQRQRLKVVGHSLT